MKVATQLVLLGILTSVSASCSALFPHETVVVPENDQGILDKLRKAHGDHTYYYLKSGVANLNEASGANEISLIKKAEKVSTAEAKKIGLCPHGLVFVDESFTGYEYGSITLHFYCKE